MTKEEFAKRAQRHLIEGDSRWSGTLWVDASPSGDTGGRDLSGPPEFVALDLAWKLAELLQGEAAEVYAGEANPDTPLRVTVELYCGCAYIHTPAPATAPAPSPEQKPTPLPTAKNSYHCIGCTNPVCPRCYSVLERGTEATKSPVAVIGQCYTCKNRLAIHITDDPHILPPALDGQWCQCLSCRGAICSYCSSPVSLRHLQDRIPVGVVSQCRECLVRSLAISDPA